MGHTTPSWRRLLLVIGLTAVFSTLSCDQSPRAGAGSKGKRVASLSPAATDMLMSMGAGAHLVAVSNFESSPLVKDLPRVGDYQTTDWETLARLRPDAMIIQIAPDRLPPGLKQRADELQIELVNVKIDHLEDIFNVMQRLGAVAGENEKGRGSVRKLREEMDELRARCAAQPPVSTLIVRDENGRDVIGPGNYLDDLLKVINAPNAAKDLGKPYPSIDREKLVALKPEAVIVLLPSAHPQMLEQSSRFWASMTQVPAVANGRVSTIVDGYALVPGPHVLDLAKKMAASLRPAPQTPLQGEK